MVIDAGNVDDMVAWMRWTLSTKLLKFNTCLAHSRLQAVDCRLAVQELLRLHPDGPLVTGGLFDTTLQTARDVIMPSRATFEAAM